MGTLLEYIKFLCYINKEIMARQARKQQQSTLFSITHQGKMPLFRSNYDREAFIQILKTAQEKYGFVCYAYCLLDDTRFHLVLDVGKSSVSKIMQSISVAYVSYYKPNQKLFSQRFKSKALYSQDQVAQEIMRIHQNTESKYNSYCVYQPDFKDDLSWVTPLTNHSIITIDQPNQPATNKQIEAYLKNWLMQNQCDQQQIKQNKQLRNQCIATLYREANVSLKQIGELFGGLSESTISKIVKQTVQES